MRPLTPKTRGAIVYSYNCGHSSCTIAKQLGCRKTTVNDILKRLREIHSLTPKKPTGRPPLLDSPAQQKLKTFVKENGENRQLCSKKIATVWMAQTKQSVSHRTVRHNLKNWTHSLYSSSQTCNDRNTLSGLSWVGSWTWNWTVRKWRRVLFSDKSTFTQFQQGCQEMVWCEPGEELNPDCVSVTVKYSSSKMFWVDFPGMVLGQLFK